MAQLVFIHKGCPNYLAPIIQNTAKYCKDFVLLGDNSNRNLYKKWYNMDDYVDNRYEEFKTKYIHMSSNDYEFELVCFKRYFCVYDYARKHNINELWMLDSDLIIYEDISELDMNKYDVAYFKWSGTDLEYNWTISPHCSYWTLDAMDDFIEFLMEAYTHQINILREKWCFHKKNNINGGICDMTLLYLWDRQKRWRVFNTGTITYDNTVFDSYVNSELLANESVVMNVKLGLKRISFIEKKPLFQLQDGTLIKAKTIHAQGPRKMYILNLIRCDSAYLLYRVSWINFYMNRLKLKIGKFLLNSV